MFCPVRTPVRLATKVVARIVFLNNLFEKRGERAPVTAPTPPGASKPAPAPTPPAGCGCGCDAH